MSNSEKVEVTVSTVADLVRKAESVQTIEGVPVLVLDNDQRHQEMEHLLPNPPSIKEHVKVVEVDSFVEYWSRYQNADSVIFVDDKANTINAVFDYHGAEPEWCRHKMTLSLLPTPEWAKWRQYSSKRLGQVEFAEFIQDNMTDVVNPDGATLLEIVTNLSNHRTAKFASNIRLDNGQVQFTYEEELMGFAVAGNMSIPQEFELGIRPFARCVSYSVGARLRYRITDERTLTIWYEIKRPERVEIDAFDGVLKELIGKVGADVPMFYGSR